MTSDLVNQYHIMNNEDMSGLDKAFETVEAVSTEVTPEKPQPVKKVEGKDEVQDDYEYARGTVSYTHLTLPTKRIV